MFAESIHSLADTMNQLILAYGIHKSTQLADPDHPYGYSNMKYVTSLISGVGIFCVGTGLSFYHGIQGLMHPQPLDDLFWAFCILGGSLVSEGATLVVAINSIREGAKSAGMSFRECAESELPAACPPDALLLDGPHPGGSWMRKKLRGDTGCGHQMPPAPANSVENGWNDERRWCLDDFFYWLADEWDGDEGD